MSARNFSSYDYDSFEIISGTSDKPLEVIYKRGTKIIRRIIIDGYDGNTPIFRGVYLKNQRLNVAEGHFDNFGTIESADQKLEVFNINGITQNPSSVSHTMINSSNKNFDFLSTAGTLTFVSSSDNDTSSGIGASTLLVTGLNSDYETIIDTVQLNGLSFVTTNSNTSDWYRINKVEVVELGLLSNQFNSNYGDISILKDGVVIGKILKDFGKAFLGMYTVPSNSTALILNIEIDGFTRCEYDIKILSKTQTNSSKCLRKFLFSTTFKTTEVFKLEEKTDFFITSKQVRGSSIHPLTFSTSIRLL